MITRAALVDRIHRTRFAVQASVAGPTWVRWSDYAVVPPELVELTAAELGLP